MRARIKTFAADSIRSCHLDAEAAPPRCSGGWRRAVAYAALTWPDRRERVKHGRHRGAGFDGCAGRCRAPATSSAWRARSQVRPRSSARRRGYGQGKHTLNQRGEGRASPSAISSLLGGRDYRSEQAGTGRAPGIARAASSEERSPRQGLRRNTPSGSACGIARVVGVS